MASFLSPPPGTAWDNTTQLDRATLPVKDSLCKWKVIKMSPAVLQRPPWCHSRHTVLENGISSNLRGKLVHLWDTGTADLRWEVRTVKTHTHVMLKSIPWHLPLGKDSALSYVATYQTTLEASPLELESWWSTPHVSTTLPSLTELCCGPAVRNIIRRGRSISLKQTSISWYCKFVPSLTHTCTKTCYSSSTKWSLCQSWDPSTKKNHSVAAEASPLYLEREDIHSSICSQKSPSLQGLPHRGKLKVSFANLSLFCFSSLPAMMIPEPLITKADVYSHMGGFPVYSGYCITLH